jgi:hypothetical protein
MKPNRFVGIDLTDSYAKTPRAVDVATLDAQTGQVVFDKFKWPPQGADWAVEVGRLNLQMMRTPPTYLRLFRVPFGAFVIGAQNLFDEKGLSWGATKGVRFSKQLAATSVTRANQRTTNWTPAFAPRWAGFFSFRKLTGRSSLLRLPYHPLSRM